MAVAGAGVVLVVVAAGVVLVVVAAGVVTVVSPTTPPIPLPL